MDDEFFTVPEVARRLKISRTKVYEMIAKNQIGHVRLGRNVRIPAAALAEYVQAHTIARSYTNSYTLNTTTPR